MKIKKIIAGMAASVVALSAMAVSASALEANQKAYQFGGAQVSWGWDVDGDKVDDSVDGVNGETWLGTIDAETGEATLQIPVEKGAVVDIYCLAWDSITDTPIFTATINGTTTDCYYSAEKPAVTYTVEDDITTLEVEIKWILTDGTDGSFNDWCGSGVVVTLPTDEPTTEEPTTEEPTTEEPTTEEPTTEEPSEPGNTGLAGVALAGVALAGAAVVASKKRR